MVTHVFPERVLLRFWAKVEKTDGCWLWRGTRNRDGYGVMAMPMRVQGRTAWLMERASRVMCILDGRPPGKQRVRHSCDNPPCVRPEHLVLGSDADNVRDMIARGRIPRGEARGHSKLTAAQVVEIRNRYAADTHLSCAALARDYKVNPQTIWMILRRKMWTHVGGAEAPLHPRRVSKLNEAQVEDIIRTYAQGDVSQPTLARQYGVRSQSVYAILRGQTYRRVWARLELKPPLVRQHWLTGKLTAEQAMAVKGRARAGERQSVLAREYAVTPTAISAIVTGKNWKELA